MAPRVSLMIPCFINQMFPETGIATVRILEHFGCEVDYPEDQTCCGQPAFNSGYWDESAVLADRLMEIFSDAEYIVTPSGSCGSLMKKLYSSLPLSNERMAFWEKWHQRVFELTEFLDQVLKIDQWPGVFPHKVTLHDACHGLRELGISTAPRRWLQSIDQLQYIEMLRPDTCCGFGGTFAVKFSGISTAMVENKAGWILDSGAEIVTAADSSCLMHIDGYLKRQGHAVKTMHLADILWQALEKKRQNAGATVI